MKQIAPQPTSLDDDSFRQWTTNQHYIYWDFQWVRYIETLIYYTLCVVCEQMNWIILVAQISTQPTLLYDDVYW